MDFVGNAISGGPNASFTYYFDCKPIMMPTGSKLSLLL